MFSPRTQRRLSVILVIIVALGLIVLAVGPGVVSSPVGPTGFLTSVFA